ncbi:MAG TPA: hypothetical protein VIT44_02715 [Cyclobacteriaceae bacterium]
MSKEQFVAAIQKSYTIAGASIYLGAGLCDELSIDPFQFSAIK